MHAHTYLYTVCLCAHRCGIVVYSENKLKHLNLNTGTHNLNMTSCYN